MASSTEQHRYHHRRSPALNSPSSHSASPRRATSRSSRPRMRSSIRGMRSWVQACRPYVEPGGHQFQDRWLHGVDRGEHPGDRTGPALAASGTSPRGGRRGGDGRARSRTPPPAPLPHRWESGRRDGWPGCAGSFVAPKDMRRTSYGWPTVLQRPANKRVAPGPGRHRASVRTRPMTMLIVRVLWVQSGIATSTSRSSKAQRLLPAEMTICSSGIVSGIPSWTTCTSVPRGHGAQADRRDHACRAGWDRRNGRRGRYARSAPVPDRCRRSCGRCRWRNS